MKYIVERHTYAPELNTIYRKTAQGAWVLLARAGSSMGRKAFSTVREYRQGNQPMKPAIHAVIRTHYADPALKWLERTYAGLVTSRQDALGFARARREQLAEGGTLSVQTMLVG